MIKIMPSKTSTPARRRSERAAAHDGDLRQQIIDTARKLLDERGAAALSMREVARRAGVTHQAPYHHFEDRESILAELVAQGFTELGQRLAGANQLAASQGRRAALLAAGEAYIGFALTYPGIFRVMFRVDVCNPLRFPAVLEAGARAHAELERMVQIIHGETPSDVLASLYWSHVHGLACLLIDGPLGLRLPTEQLRRAHIREVGRRFIELLLDKEE